MVVATVREFVNQPQKQIPNIPKERKDAESKKISSILF
jgi:hypothetical protein